MNDKYGSLSLTALRELAKEQGIKGISALRKQELIDALQQRDVTMDKNQAETGKESDVISAEHKRVIKKAANTEVRTEVNSEPKAETNDEAKSVINSEAKVVINNEVKPATNNEAKSEDSNEIKKEVNTELKTEIKREVRNENSRMTNNRSEIPRSEDNRFDPARTVRNRSDNYRDGKRFDNNRTYNNNNNNNRRTDMRTNDQDGQPQSRMNDTRQNDYRSNELRQNDPRSNDTRSNDTRQNDYRSNESRQNDTRSNDFRTNDTRQNDTRQSEAAVPTEYEQLDSGETKEGILEVLAEGYGFIRCDNFLPGENDVYVSPAQIRRFNLKTGDIIVGNTRVRNQNEKFSALLYVKTINGLHPSDATKRKRFEDLTPIFPNERIHLETPGCGPSMRMVDLISPIGKGQRGMIVSQPKAGKTTLLKQIAKSITINHPDMHMIILLIDERPEEVTDIKESIEGGNVEVIYSTFDELPENHKRVSEMVIERAKRLVEHKKDVVILLDSITRLARAYNLTVQASGRTLSGGLDPAALHMPKRFFGAARNMREGGSLTILATALVDTGSRMDDVVFEEFKGTGNMELVLDRSLSEKRIFPAIDLAKSSTRRDDLLLSQPEVEANFLMRRALNGLKSEEALERIVQMFVQTKSNKEFIELVKKTRL